MRAGLSTFQFDSTPIKASPKRENPIKTKDRDDDDDDNDNDNDNDNDFFIL